MAHKKPDVVETDDSVSGGDALHACASDKVEETLERLNRLLREGAIDEARALVQGAKQRWPESPRVQKWARLLELPRVRVLKGRRSPSRDQEYAWLHNHAHEHPGQWLALRGDQLIAADADLSEVLAIADRAGRVGDILLHFQPEKVWTQ